MSRPLFVGGYLQVTWWAPSQWKWGKNASNDNEYYLFNGTERLLRRSHIYNLVKFADFALSVRNHPSYMAAKYFFEGDSSEIKVTDQFFLKTFLESSLLSTVSKKKQQKWWVTILAWEIWWANLIPFMSVLVLITRTVHRFKLRFAVARNILY